MLEYNFNEIDNDFITCWCKYLLTGDKKMIMKDLEALAELGQINAIQNWYLFNKVGDNPYIDKIVEELGDSYNENFVKARIGAKELEQIEEQNRLLAYVNEEEWVSGIRSGYYELTERARECRKKVTDLPYIDLYYSAVNRAFQIGNRTNDILVLEAANEMYSELADVIGIESYENDIYKRVRKNNAKICDDILKSFKKEKKENSSFNPLEKPRTCFVFLKAILLYNKKHKQKDNAIEMLKSLANREYSTKFASYINTNKR